MSILQVDDYPYESTAYVGTPGFMVPIPVGNDASIEENIPDQFSFKTTVTGRVHAQGTPFNRRSWTINGSSLPRECYKQLRMLASGALGDGPLYFDLPQFRTQNLISPDDSRMRSKTANVLFATVFPQFGGGWSRTGAQHYGYEIQPGSAQMDDPNGEFFPVTDDFVGFKKMSDTCVLIFGGWVSGKDCRIRLRFKDSAGVVITDQFGESKKASDSQPVKVAGYSGIPDGAVSAFLEVGGAPSGTPGGQRFAGLGVVFGDVNGWTDRPEIADINVTDPSAWDIPIGHGCPQCTISVNKYAYGQYDANGYWEQPDIIITEVG